MMKDTPSTRPDMVLLLQPWSTAIIDMTNSSMARLPANFNHITHSHRVAHRLRGCTRKWSRRLDEAAVMAVTHLALSQLHDRGPLSAVLQRDWFGKRSCRLLA